MSIFTKHHEDGNSDLVNEPMFFHYVTLLETRGFFVPFLTSLSFLLGKGKVFRLANNIPLSSKEVVDFLLYQFENYILKEKQT